MSQTPSKTKPETLTLPSGRVVILPTDEEDAAINAGIAADPDTYEFSAAEFKQLRPLRGRPAGSVAAKVKTPIKIRLDNRVLDAFKATGRGWQTRMNATLLEAVEQGRVHA